MGQPDLPGDVELPEDERQAIEAKVCEWMAKRRLPPFQPDAIRPSLISDTRPDSPAPPDSFIVAAMREVPARLADMESTREFYAPAPAQEQRIVLYSRLVRELVEKHGHGKAAAEWAIHRLVEQGLLRALCGRIDVPAAQSIDGVWQSVRPQEVRELKYSLIESTVRLWEWWRMLERDQTDSRSRPAHERGRPTERTWYFDLSGVKVGKKTPLTVAHFEDFFKLLPDRGESERSWTVARAEIEAKGYDLKAVNPNAKSTADTRTPEELLELIEAKGREVAEALAALRSAKKE
jgi:hypothetical protein